MYKLERVTKTGSKEFMFLIKVDGVIVGLLTKYKDTSTETHPWKAFRDVGMNCKYIAAYYKEMGGKQAAINAVLSGLEIHYNGPEHINVIDPARKLLIKTFDSHDAAAVYIASAVSAA